MARYVARRLGLMVVAVVGVTLISFLISHAVPADPIVSNLGQQASDRPEIVKAFKEKWGLDKPLYVQYLTFLGNLTRGELGTSINTRRAIAKDLKAFLPATIELSTVAVLFALAIGVPLGIVAAIRRATRLALAMDARGFGSRDCRTLARPRALAREDAVLVAAALLLAVSATSLSVALGTWRPLIAF